MDRSVDTIDSIDDAMSLDDSECDDVTESEMSDGGKILVDEFEPDIDVEDSPFEPRDVTIRTDKWVTDEFEILDFLGRGKFGEVKRCREKETGREFAAKFICAPRPQDKKDVQHEVEIMKKLQHKRLLQLYDAYSAKNEMCIVLELILGGELFDRVIDDDFILTERACVIFMRQICEGIRYMHDHNIIHLDMKPENILCLTRTGNRIKIIDFGLAREYDPKKDLRVLFGTPEFMAPEVVQYDRISFSTDMWSVGAICYVLLSGLSPFMGDNDGETLSNVIKGEYDFCYREFEDVSEGAKDLIRKLLVKDISKRLTADQCLEHPWLTLENNPLFMETHVSREECESPPLSLTKKRLKGFVHRRKWQKIVNAMIALKRMGVQLVNLKEKPTPPVLQPEPMFQFSPVEDDQVVPPVDQAGVSFNVEEDECMYNGELSTISDTDYDTQTEDFSTELFISEDAFISEDPPDISCGTMTNDFIVSEDSFTMTNGDGGGTSDVIGTVTSDAVTIESTCLVTDNVPMSDDSVTVVSSDPEVNNNICTVNIPAREPQVIAHVVETSNTPENTCNVTVQDHKDKPIATFVNDVVSHENKCLIQPCDSGEDTRKSDESNKIKTRKPKGRVKAPPSPTEGDIKNQVNVQHHPRARQVSKSPSPNNLSEYSNGSSKNRGTGERLLGDTIRERSLSFGHKEDNKIKQVDAVYVTPSQRNRIKTSPFKIRDISPNDDSSQDSGLPSSIELHDRKTCKNRIKESPFTQKDSTGEGDSSSSPDSSGCVAEMIVLSAGRKIKASPFTQRDSWSSLGSMESLTDSPLSTPLPPSVCTSNNRVKTSPFRQREKESPSANKKADLSPKPCRNRIKIRTPQDSFEEEIPAGDSMDKPKDIVEGKPPLIVRQKIKWTPSPENKLPVFNRIRKTPSPAWSKESTGSGNEQLSKPKDSETRRSFNNLHKAFENNAKFEDYPTVSNNTKKRQTRNDVIKRMNVERSEPDGEEAVSGGKDTPETLAPLPIRHVPSSQDLEVGIMEKEATGGFFRNRLTLFGRNLGNSQSQPKESKVRMWVRDSGLKAPVKQNNVSFLAKAFGFQAKGKTDYPIAHSSSIKRKGSKKKKDKDQNQGEVKQTKVIWSDGSGNEGHRQETTITKIHDNKIINNISLTESKTETTADGVKVTENKKITMSFSKAIQK